MAVSMPAPGTPASSSGKSASKSSKASKKIILRLPSRLLEQFPSSLLPVKLIKLSPGTPSTPSAANTHDPESPAPADASEHNGTPARENEAENGDTPTAASNGKRKPGPAPRGIKRAAPSTDANGVVKPRGKPGPKRRKKPEDEQADESAKGGAWTGPAPIAGQKLGPKANQGAINAGLRALDRSGAKCRRWERKSYELKSFTGVMWLMPQWSTPKLKESPVSDLKSDDTPSNDGKAELASSVMGSVSSQADGEVNGHETNGITSSPAAAQTPVDAPA